jgi:hypothetical protein
MKPVMLVDESERLIFFNTESDMVWTSRHSFPSTGIMKRV